MKRLIYFLLTLLGFGAVSCEESGLGDGGNLNEYGTPYASYRINARVVDSEGNPIGGIKVESQSGEEFGVSDTDGNINCEYRDSSLANIIFRDVDGLENGGEFENVVLAWNDFYKKLEKVEEGEGWYQGVYELELGDVEMTLKSDENTEE